MNAADSELASQICLELVAKKLITEKEVQQFQGKLALGTMSATEWTTWVRAGLATEGSSNASAKS